MCKENRLLTVFQIWLLALANFNMSTGATWWGENNTTYFNCPNICSSAIRNKISSDESNIVHKRFALWSMLLSSLCPYTLQLYQTYTPVLCRIGTTTTLPGDRTLSPLRVKTSIQLTPRLEEVWTSVISILASLGLFPGKNLAVP